MLKGRGGMGVAKHRKSGHALKGPKLVQALKRMAEADERKAHKSLPFNSVKEAFNAKTK